MNGNQQISRMVSLGERLRQAREAMGLTQQDIAKYLCLKLSMIKNIEEGYCSDLLKISPIFLNGYIRAYARLVNINNMEEVILVDQLPPVLFSSVKNIKKENSIIAVYNSCSKKIKFFILCCCILFVFFIIVFIVWHLKYFFSKYEYFGVMNLKSVQSIINLQDRVNIERQFKKDFLYKNFYIYDSLYFFNYAHQMSLLCSLFGNFEDIDILLYQTRFDNFIYNMINNHINNVNNCIIGHTNNNILVLSFTSDCWIEVVDAADKILYVGTKYSGDILNLEGEIPYRLVIGAPKSINIQYRGNIVNIDQFIHANKVARLTIPCCL